MHIIVFFTYGVSLKLWGDTGLIGRELLIYRKFIEDGHQVTLITYGDENDSKFYPHIGKIKVVPVYSYIRRPNNRLLRFLQSMLIPFYFRQLFYSADILKTNQMRGAWVPAIAKLLFRKKLIVRCGYELFRNLVRERNISNESFFSFVFVYLLEFFIYRFADKIIISSETDRNFICKVFHIRPNKITLLHNFIDTDLFYPQDSEKKDNAILYIGRLHKRKNLLTLIKALKGTPYRLDIIGEGEQKEVLEHYALKNNIDIHFLGTFRNDELPNLINRYPVFVLTSFYENNPKTLLEAMSCGIAVIGTDVDGIRELIRDSQDGLLCAPNFTSVRKAINEAMESQNLRIKLGANAREFIVNNCSLEIIFEKELAVFRTILH